MIRKHDGYLVYNKLGGTLPRVHFQWQRQGDFSLRIFKKWLQNKRGTKTVKRLGYLHNEEIKKEENYTFLQHCAVYVSDGNKRIDSADLQHCNSCLSFHLQPLYLNPISPCWCLPQSTQAKWEISTHIRGSLTRRPKRTLPWKDDIKLIVSFVPLKLSIFSRKISSLSQLFKSLPILPYWNIIGRLLSD